MSDPLALYGDLMDRAIAVARRGIAAGQSPFGAVVATEAGEVIAESHNTVRLDGDATAHAEINVIRRACAHLGTTDLRGHLIATTCEPCPMCAAAIHWARLDTVICGAEIADAGRSGFNELSLAAADLYRQGGSPVRVVAHVEQARCRELFALWQRGPNPTAY